VQPCVGDELLQGFNGGGGSWRWHLFWLLQLRLKGETDAADGEGDVVASRLVGDL
jgi:hypothetical protein